VTCCPEHTLASLVQHGLWPLRSKSTSVCLTLEVARVFHHVSHIHAALHAHFRPNQDTTAITEFCNPFCYPITNCITPKITHKCNTNYSFLLYLQMLRSASHESVFDALQRILPEPMPPDSRNHMVEAMDQFHSATWRSEMRTTNGTFTKALCRVCDARCCRFSVNAPITTANRNRNVIGASAGADDTSEGDGHNTHLCVSASAARRLVQDILATCPDLQVESKLAHLEHEGVRCQVDGMRMARRGTSYGSAVPRKPADFSYVFHPGDAHHASLLASLDAEKAAPASTVTVMQRNKLLSDSVRTKHGYQECEIRVVLRLCRGCSISSSSV
jgi:hypothetical protein